MATTLYLDPATWDLTLDSGGNIAVAAAPWAVAQDAASEIRTFTGECWYDQLRGIPYWGDYIGKPFSPEALRADMVRCALLAPGAASAKVFFSGFSRGVVTGQVQITDGTGTTIAVGF